MKHNRHFTDFLKDTVNLNQTRLDQLADSADAIKKFVRQAEWEPSIARFADQGSWAHQTIIKPLDGNEFDADLLVFVRPVDGWTAADYVKTLGKVFSDSATYGDKSKTWEYCVTITYAGDRKLDVAPCVIDRRHDGSVEVCDRANDTFEPSTPEEFTQWLKDQNRYSGQNSFRKTTRLLKYLRDIKTRFTCPSVLLTTLLGEQIWWNDKDSEAFKDVSSAFRTLMARLDDWLQSNAGKPLVNVAALPPDEDLGRLWSADQYSNFRDCIHRYREWTDDAFEEEDSIESIKKWRRLFGDKFAAGVDVTKAELSAVATIRRSLMETTAAHLDELVDSVKAWGISFLPPSFKNVPYMQTPPWGQLSNLIGGYRVTATYHARKSNSQQVVVVNGQALPPRGGLWFAAHGPGGAPIDHGKYFVRWRITNTGAFAIKIGKGRGEFNHPNGQNGMRWEELEYRGVHLSEAFIIRRADDTLVAQSDPFYVVIE